MPVEDDMHYFDGKECLCDSDPMKCKVLLNTCMIGILGEPCDCYSSGIAIDGPAKCRDWRDNYIKTTREMEKVNKLNVRM